jgi:hypothetical protein
MRHVMPEVAVLRFRSTDSLFCAADCLLEDRYRFSRQV